MIDRVISYFDLNMEARAKRAVAAGTGAKPGVPWLLQYLVLIAGIIVQPSFSAYQQTHQLTWPYGPGYLLMSAVVGVIIFPAVYRKAFDDEDPKLISLAPIFTAGLGWQTLLAAAVK